MHVLSALFRRPLTLVSRNLDCNALSSFPSFARTLAVASLTAMATGEQQAPKKHWIGVDHDAPKSKFNADQDKYSVSAVSWGTFTAWGVGTRRNAIQDKRPATHTPASGQSSRFVPVRI